MRYHGLPGALSISTLEGINNTLVGLQGCLLARDLICIFFQVLLFPQHITNIKIGNKMFNPRNISCCPPGITRGLAAAITTLKAHPIR
jgi:hypothetical protein